MAVPVVAVVAIVVMAMGVVAKIVATVVVLALADTALLLADSSNGWNGGTRVNGTDASVSGSGMV